ncbi:MAG: hypothetical protein H6661_02640 [Ardenticatenaceae bacterium]|nr:hypothetical protein [Ardenticatenaceae bacterium]
MVGSKLKTTKKTKTTTTCPVCHGLVSAERPRFFAGQLLTETELNSLENYVLAKNRLHNRYLHGVGVVCGLEVSCHDCDGVVTIAPGYAIDPCGNDIVLSEADAFDVIEAIKQCRRSDRTQEDCVPWRSRRESRCDDVEERWCITIQYLEKEASPTTPLLRAQKSCGCGTNGASNGRHTASRAPTASCEPTRIHESYRLCVRPAPETCTDDWRDRLKTPLGPLQECFTGLTTFAASQFALQKFSTAELAQVLGVAFAAQVPGEFSYDQAQALHNLCERFWCFVYALFKQNPLGHDAHCAITAVLDDLTCSPPTPPSPDGNFSNYNDYFRGVQSNFQALLNLVFEYIIECFCHHLLPPCPPDEESDELVLACLTIRDDKIIRIGNFCCRRHAGSFPAVSHWLSLIPLLPLLWEGVKQLCCEPAIMSLLGRAAVRFDSDNRFVRGVTAENFAAPRAMAASLARTFSGANLGAVMQRMNVSQAVNLAEMVDKPLAAAEPAFAAQNLQMVSREVASAADVSPLDTLTAPLTAVSGDQIIAYHTPDGRIVGFKRYDVTAELEAKRTELADLRQELTSIRADLLAMRKGK